jgi:hypothetical protein
MMQRTRTRRNLPAIIAVVVGVLGVIAGGCASAAVKGSPATFAQTPSGSTTATLPTEIPTTVAGAPPKRTGVLGTAQSLGCSSDLATLETAIQTFFAINGKYPSSEAEMVQGGIIATESKMHDIGPDGTIVPSPIGGCTK